MPICLYLRVERFSAGMLFRRRREKQALVSLMTNRVLPNIYLSLPVDYVSGSYPWCFVISPGVLNGRAYYIGAVQFLPHEQGQSMLHILYSPVSWRWLSKNQRSEYPLTFWMARILNRVRENHFSVHRGSDLWQWISALQRAYSPVWETLALTSAYRFKNRSHILLMEGGREDYAIQHHDGVDVMPWKNWPDCTLEPKQIWLWRQSRHRKVLDAQTISLWER